MRLAQIHESFRTAELRALAVMAGTEMEIVRYDDDVGEFFFFVQYLYWWFDSGKSEQERDGAEESKERVGIYLGNVWHLRIFLTEALLRILRFLITTLPRVSLYQSSHLT